MKAPEAAIAASAAAFVRAQRTNRGSVGKRQIVDAVATMPFTDYFDTVSQAQQTRITPQRDLVFHEDLCVDILHSLVSGQSVLVSGLGSHQSFLRDFTTRYLTGEDVIEMLVPSDQPYHITEASSENSSVATIRQLLQTIASDVLQLSDFALAQDSSLWPRLALRLSSQLEAHYDQHPVAKRLCATQVQAGRVRHSVDYTSSKQIAGSGGTSAKQGGAAASSYQYGRYAHTQTRLFVVLEDVSSLSSLAATCLSCLAQSRGLAMLCSTSRLFLGGGPWDEACRSFRVVSMLGSSSQASSLLPADHIFFRGRGGARGGVGGASSEVLGTDVLVSVLQSVDEVCKEVLQLLCAASLAPPRGTSSAAAPGAAPVRAVALTELAELCAQRLLVRSRDEVWTKLQPLLDTGVVCAQTAQSSQNAQKVGKAAGRAEGRVLRLGLSLEDTRWIAGVTDSGQSGTAVAAAAPSTAARRGGTAADSAAAAKIDAQQSDDDSDRSRGSDEEDDEEDDDSDDGDDRSEHAQLLGVRRRTHTHRSSAKTHAKGKAKQSKGPAKKSKKQKR